MADYTILPFRFARSEDGDVLLVNECGDYLWLSAGAFAKFVRHGLDADSPDFFRLKSHLLLAQGDLDVPRRKMAARYRTRKSFLREFTTLHMMVVTLRCNQRCDYCQVSCADESAHAYDMDLNTARAIVDMILQAPGMALKIEFQGGEPLLNWDVVEGAVTYAEGRNKGQGKELEFVVCTNLTTATRAQLEFCRDHKVYISTSLDGPADLHDSCRKTRLGGPTYGLFLEKLDLAREIMGPGSVSALMTTSSRSLERMGEVIDEYFRLGLPGIFIRALNPYGFAAEQATELGYGAEEFAARYLDALRYIMKLNSRRYFPEYFATLLFTRILTPFATGFVDLQSPSGAGISGAIYDYDGSVFPADEARMLARMGDRHFCLGNVFNDGYRDIFGGRRMRDITARACVETTPSCAWCAYQTFCGTDPVRNYLETGDEMRLMAGSPFCRKNKTILNGLFGILKGANDDALDVIWSWVNNDRRLVRYHEEG